MIGVPKSHVFFKEIFMSNVTNFAILMSNLKRSKIAF